MARRRSSSQYDDILKLPANFPGRNICYLAIHSMTLQVYSALFCSTEQIELLAPLSRRPLPVVLRSSLARTSASLDNNHIETSMAIHRLQQ